MKREEIEKILEESGRQARNEHRRGLNRDKIRNLLNLLFLAGAAIGVVLYFALPESRFTGLSIIGVAMLLKVIEFFLRFML